MQSWEEYLKEWVDSLKPSQIESLKKIILNHKDNTNTKYDLIEIRSDDNTIKRVITGFDTWKEMLDEMARLSKNEYKGFRIVEITKMFEREDWVITDYDVSEAYDLKEIIEDIDDVNFDKKVFDYDDELDSMKQSVEYLIDNNEYGDAGQLLLCFDEIMNKYNRIDADKQILLHNNLLDYEVHNRFVMEHSFGCYKKMIGILIKEV